ASRAYYDKNAPKTHAITKPSSPWPGADQTSCSRCSKTAPSTNLAQQNSRQPLDKNHRGILSPCCLSGKPSAVTTTVVPRTINSAKLTIQCRNCHGPSV